jgi:transcription termination factor NusB
MDHIKSYEEFASESNNTEKVATVTTENKNYVVEYKGDQIIVKGSANEDDQDETLQKIAEAARRLGATHVYNENENPKKVAVNEIIGAIKTLFKKQPAHKSIWGHINQD